MDSSNFSDFIDEKWQIYLSDGSLRELVPNGKTIPLTFENREEYVRLSIAARLNESKRQMEAVRRGFLSVVPECVVSLCLVNELETMVCGNVEIDIDFLKANTDGVRKLALSSSHFLNQLSRVMWLIK